MLLNAEKIALADSLRRFRREFNLTQKQVAEGIGMAESGYQRYEQGRAMPSVEVIERIADKFHVSTDYLLGRSTTVHVSEESPEIASPEFLDNLIFKTRLEHDERLKLAEGKVDNPAIEYADLLLRRYHQAILSKLLESGIKI